MRIPQRFWSATFEQISGPDSPSTDETRVMIAGYLNNVSAIRKRGAGLLLWGPNGTGKTSIGSVILKAIRRQFLTGLFLNSAEIKTIVISKEMYDSERNVTLWKRAQDVDFLVLDDLGKGSLDSTGFGERLIDELIRTRYAQCRPTIITTNVPKAKLTEFIKPSTLHILKGSSAQLKIEKHDFRVEEGISVRKFILGGGK
tara:strand:- start:1666 stop:2265 length:600 start_codon:yes stop_codon:yes gene_type:complete